MESANRTVNDFQTGSFLHREVDEKGPVLQLGEGLEGHELVVRLGRPGVDLDGVAQGDDQELDSLVLDDLEVDGPLQVAHVDPAGAPLDGVVGSEDLGLEPGKVVDANSVLFA